MDEIESIFNDKIIYCKSLNESIEQSSGIILITEWDEFRNVDFKNIGNKMKEKVMFDGRNIYEPKLLKKEKFEYYGVGRR